MKPFCYTRGHTVALEELGLPKLAAESREFAPGIPADRKIQTLPTVKKPQEWTMSLQRHHAERAGEHLDLRLVDHRSGQAHSWALPGGRLPEPAKSVLAVQQPTHTQQYAMEFGLKKTQKIRAGYGKGTVKIEDQRPVDVYHSKPEEEGTRLRFNMYKGTHPEEYALVRTSSGQDILVNKTLSKSRLEHLSLGTKPVTKELTADKLDLENSDEVMMPKLDGAHTLIDMKQPERIPRLFSYRQGKRSSTGVIEHTHKAPSLLTQRVPKELKGTVLRAETIAVTRAGKALPAKDLAGMLNASVSNSREKQKELNVTVKPIAFDIWKYKGKDVSALPFSERYKLLQEVRDKTDIEIVDVATTTGAKQKLLAKIKDGRHPLTNEGVIVRSNSASGKATKFKFRPDYDVYVRKIFPIQNKNRAGGFEYSWTPKGKVTGRVGTGFSHAMAEDMLKNPERYVGRAAKVQAETKFQSGKLSKPAFQEWHLDKGKI